MVLERTSVGLDVHARSVVAGVLDTVTGELRSLRLPPATEAVVSWVGWLPGPVVVAYEAGPTRVRAGQGVAAGRRSMCGGGVEVGTPARDRVKTDRRDAERLVHIG
jgi:hypothetical protein